MARETFTTLQQSAHDYTQTTTSDTDVNTILKKEINNAVTFIFSDLRDYVGHTVQTAFTVADQQYYHNAPDLSSIVSVTITINGVIYNLLPVDSQNEWNNLNTITFSGNAIPKYFFQRVNDFGIWPIPQDAYTITVTYNYIPVDMQNADYTTGTVSVTQNDATVTGSGTTFTALMVGRWFKVNNYGQWYKIASYTSATSIELESVYEEATASTQNYTIGESPNLPVEAHSIIPYYAASMFFGGYKKDATQGQFFENMFMTGNGFDARRTMDDMHAGYLGLKKRYMQRSDSALVRRNKSRYDNPFNSRIWGTTLS